MMKSRIGINNLKRLHMKKIYLIYILQLSSLLCSAQIISPYSKPNTIQPSDAEGVKFGWFPFQKENELQILYDRGALSAPNSISLSSVLRDSINANSSFVEFLSFIPKESYFKLGASLLLTSEEKDSSNNPQDVALQKLVNGGGNLSLNLSKPIYYNEFYKSNYFLVNATLSGFADIGAVNKKIYNPSAGLQFNLDSDFRIFSEGTSSQNGNLFRSGFKLGFTKNFFNVNYYENSDELKGLRNVAFGRVEFYLGLAFLDIKYSHILSGEKLFESRKSILEISIMPVKF
jgi:hypothetical protein